jgi:hypothetical protein
MSEFRKPQVGDVIQSVFGYDATFVRYYEVVKATEKTVTLVRLAQGVIDRNGGPTEFVVPTTEHVGEPFRRKVKVLRQWDQQGQETLYWSVQIRQYEYASSFATGGPQAQTAPGWY